MDFPKGTPTLKEWKKLTKPSMWPYLRPSQFAIPDQPSPNTILGMHFSRDETGSDYDPEDDDDGNHSNSTNETEDIESHPIEAWEAEEFKTMDQSTTSLATNHLDTEAILAAKIKLLEVAEAKSAAEYSPDEIAALMEEWYDLLIKMGHWPPEAVSKAPHTSTPIDVQLGKELGYEPQVLDLMQKLPYVNEEWNSSEHHIIPNTSLLDYRLRTTLNSSRCPPIPHDKPHPPLDPWILPLTSPNWWGISLYLNTRLGTMIAFPAHWGVSHSGQCQTTPEWLRHGPCVEALMPRTMQHEYRRAVFVSAREYLRDVIAATRKLEVMPVVDARWNRCGDGECCRGCDGAKGGKYAEKGKEERRMVVELYKEYGWPRRWRREEFLERWRTVKVEIERKYLEEVNGAEEM